MEINKVKIHDVLKCSPSESVKEIAKKLKDKNERRIFVVDSDDKLLGIVTTTDLVYKGICDGGDLKVEDVMTKDVKSVDLAKDDLNEALKIMNEIKSFVCPVTENGKLTGLISYHDLVGYVMSSIEQ